MNFISTFPLSGAAGQKIPLKSHENSHKFYKTLTRSEENFKNVDYVYNEMFGSAGNFSSRPFFRQPVLTLQKFIDKALSNFIRLKHIGFQKPAAGADFWEYPLSKKAANRSAFD